MAVQQYIGARYVPKPDGPWNSEKEYEPLTTVSYLNATYLSKKSVPAGVVPTNEEYWMRTSFESGQTAALEAWRTQVVDPFITESGEKFTQIDENITGVNSDIQQIDANFAPSENGNTSGHNYAIGDYILWKGDLCKVISAIVTGDTFTIGGNLEKTSVGKTIVDVKNDIVPTVRATATGSTYKEKLDSLANEINNVYNLPLEKRFGVILNVNSYFFKLATATSSEMRFYAAQTTGTSANNNTLFDTIVIRSNESRYIRKTLADSTISTTDLSNNPITATIDLWY